MNISFYNKQIECYKDIHHGKRCFIIATGPSLTVQDLDTLYAHNEKCISMNRIYNIFGETKWRPDYMSVSVLIITSKSGSAFFRSLTWIPHSRRQFPNC